ncbi:MAG: nucleotide exchange factor GrpE [Actinomycetota bacterium]|nr:nucleotide exchange factor GrpE [Actinomycetota bacterium]
MTNTSDEHRDDAVTAPRAHVDDVAERGGVQGVDDGGTAHAQDDVADQVTAADAHEDLGEASMPQPDVDRSDVGGDLSGGDEATIDPADQRPRIEPTPEDQPTPGDQRSREELRAALEAAESKRDEYLDHLKRTQAEFQNFRKRTMREGATQRDQGVVDVLGRLIDVLDDFELAVLAAESATDVASLRKGVEMVYGKLVDALRAFGLERIGREGVAFDPQLHEAVQHEHDGEDRDHPVVAEVLRPGYMVGDRVLRAAMVRVVE